MFESHCQLQEKPPVYYTQGVFLFVFACFQGISFFTRLETTKARSILIASGIRYGTTHSISAAPKVMGLPPEE